MRNSYAFTILELLLVMAVLGMLSAIIIVGYPSATRRARDSSRINDIKQYQNALEVYSTTNNSAYPDTSKDMDVVCTEDLDTAKCPKDPKGVNYEYVAVGSGAGYFIYITLEDVGSGGATEYFVACSNGLSGKTTTDPSGETSCPL